MLGLLLLCMGLGSILAMPATALLTSRLGCRQVITGSAAGLCLIFPVLSLAPSTWLMALSLVAFGMAMGCTSVAMNLQAVLVEKMEGRTLMSGFHAMFSLGGILGSGAMALLLALGFHAPLAALATSLTMAGLLLSARPGLLPFSDPGASRPPAFVIPQGVVLAIGCLSLLAMLAEGAVLDWGTLFIVEAQPADSALAGFGYTAFAITMTLGRFCGDRCRIAIGDLAMLITSALVATAGLAISLCLPWTAAMLGGFLLVGAGVSNIAPILFTLAGRSRAMPPNLAVAAVLTVGYVGIIAGPAAIGFIAHATSLRTAFLLLCGAMALIALTSRPIYRRL
jgi:MFS family permease